RTSKIQSESTPGEAASAGGLFYFSVPAKPLGPLRRSAAVAVQPKVRPGLPVRLPLNCAGGPPMRSYGHANPRSSGVHCVIGGGRPGPRQRTAKRGKPSPGHAKDRKSGQKESRRAGL